MFNLGSKTIVF